MRIYLIRHGETEITASGAFLGSTDLPLSARGRSQVQALAGLLPAGMLEPGTGTRVVTSPLLRARETAEAVAGRRGLEMEVDPDLREIDFGLWETLIHPEIEAGYPGELATWDSPTEDSTFPGGDRLGDFEERVSRACSRILATEAEATLVFAHGGVVRSMSCQLLGLERTHYWLLEVRPASFVRIDVWESGAVLSEVWSVSSEEARPRG